MSETRESAHNGKRPYSESQARAAAAEARRETGHDIEAYRCGYCPKWHIGHVPASKRAPFGRYA